MRGAQPLAASFASHEPSVIIDVFTLLGFGELTLFRKLICPFVLMAGTAFGQLPTSSVTGNVVDPQGLPIAGARVTITNEGTRVASDVSTTSSGEFAISGLAPGSYTVAVNQSGFKAFE